MSVIINPTDQDTYTINGKEIYKDMNGNWVCKQELNSSEQKRWNLFRESLERAKTDREIFPFGG